MKTIKQWQTEVHQLAKQKGWYDKQRTPLEYHMLIVSEIAEASEEIRNNLPAYYVEVSNEQDKPMGEFIELADAVIRIMDYFEYSGVSLELMLERKHRYNQTRPYRHGGKKL